jgi:diguanylate cyclase (GGDEF)-like protein
MISSDTTEQLVKRVDEALYGSKAAGRNCVHFHDGGEIRPAADALAKQQAPAPSVENKKTSKPAAVAPTPAATTKPVRSIAMASGDTPNLATFYGDLRRRVLECQRFNVPLSLLLVDVDNYKAMIDRLGAACGESIFKTISEVLTNTLGETDIASRYGHGQFAVMSPGSNADAAIKLAETIRTTIDARTTDQSAGSVPFTVSFGLVEAKPSDDATSLIERAEAALRASRSAGCNCTFVNTGEGCQKVELTAAVG